MVVLIFIVIIHVIDFRSNVEGISSEELVLESEVRLRPVGLVSQPTLQRKNVVGSNEFRKAQLGHIGTIIVPTLNRDLVSEMVSLFFRSGTPRRDTREKKK